MAQAKGEKSTQTSPMQAIARLRGSREARTARSRDFDRGSGSALIHILEAGN
jgi:hypothetical protein